MVFISALIAWLKRLLRLRPAPPEPRDPYAGVRVPVRKGPGSRSGAVALAEPDED